MSLKKQALSGFLWSALQIVGTQGLGIVFSLILARLLLPAEFGLIAMLGIFMGIGNTLISSGLTQSLIRTENLDEEDYATVFYFNLAGSILVYAVIFFVAPLIALFYNQPVLTLIVRIYSITFIINAFAAVQTTRLTKSLDFKTQMKVSIPSLILGSTVGVAMAYSGYGVWSLVWSAIVQALASTIQLWYWAKWKPIWAFNTQKFKYHFNYGVKLMFSGLLEIVFINAYVILIGKFFAPAQVGYYSRANTLSMLPVGLINTVVTRVTFPLFSSIQNEEERLRNMYVKIMQMVIFLIAPILIILAVLAEPLLRFLITDKWLPAVPYLQILCFTAIMYPIHGYNLQILIVKGRSDLFLRLEILKKIMITVVIIASLQFGIYGLLWGGLILSVLGFWVNTHYSGKYLQYSAWEQTKDLVPIILIGLLAGGLVYWADALFLTRRLPDIIRLIVGGLLGCVSYVGMAYIFKINSLKEFVLVLQRK